MASIFYTLECEVISEKKPMKGKYAKFSEN